MLTAVPQNWFSWNFKILDGDSTVAFVNFGWLRETGKLVIRGSTYELGREGILNRSFFLRKDGRPLASATKPSVFSRSLDVSWGENAYSLESASPFTRTFVLRSAAGKVGSIGPAQLFSRRAVVDLPESIPLEIRVFMIWLVVVLWRRSSN